MSSEALLGTITACPKCGSMVKIETPLQDVTQENALHPQVKLGNAPVDSEAITEDGIASELPDVSVGELKSGFASPPPISGPHLSDTQLPDPPLSDQATLAGPPPTWQDNENWQSAKTRRTRHIVMIATIALSTLSVTVLTFGWFLRGKKTESNPVAQVSDTLRKEIEEAPGEAVPSAPASDAKMVEPVASTENASEIDTPTESNDETPATTEAAGEPETIIPSSLIPTSPIESTGNGDTDEDVSTMKELPAGLRQFMPILLQEGPAEETSLEAPPTIKQVEIDAATEEDPNNLGIEPPKPLNLKRDLGFKVKLDSKGYPLPSLLLLISEMTGVPIQIDWTSFDLAGMDVAKPIVMNGKDKARTCRQWLDTIAGQVDAEIREKEFVIVMTLTDQAFSKAETGLLDLADFAEQSKSAEKLIQQFLGPEIQKALPDVMDARERAQLKILATEMLRRMRSIQPRLSDDRSSRWMQVGDDRFVDWQPIGDVDPTELKPGSQPDTPITTAAMLRKISSINDSVCLVNWYDANRRGMRPTRLVIPHADKVNAAKMLSSVLDPLSMEVRRVDSSHWWVGSNATYDRLPVLVHSGRLGEQREDYVRQVDEIMSTDPNAVYRSAYDPVSDRMLMLLPRYVARQLFKVSKEN